MKYYVVIPAHNEADCIGQTLVSLIQQSVIPSHVVVVNDNSTDHTGEVVQKFSKSHSFIHLVNNQSSEKHLPGSKVIKAFYKGFEILDDQYDIIVKLDADIVLPSNYFETIINHFQSDDRIGMAGGFAYIEQDGQWVLENLTNKDHIRGALKAYRKQCFSDIGQLKKAMGWDTADELLAQYHGWRIKTDESLKAKHLKPTGAIYNKAARYKQGEAFYKLRYGFVLTAIASIKLAMLKKKPLLFIDYMLGYLKAGRTKVVPLLSKAEGKFVRQLRWTGILKKLGLK